MKKEWWLLLSATISEGVINKVLRIRWNQYRIPKFRRFLRPINPRDLFKIKSKVFFSSSALIFGPIRKICNSELMRPLCGKLKYLEKLQVNENETKLLQNLFHSIVKHEKRAFLGPSFGDFWRHPQFYIQLVYWPHFGTWILLFGPFGLCWQ